MLVSILGGASEVNAFWGTNQLFVSFALTVFISFVLTMIFSKEKEIIS